MKKLSLLVLLFIGATQTEAQDWDSFINAYSDDGYGSDTLELETDDSLDIAELAFRNLFVNNKSKKPRKSSKFYILSFLHCARHMSLDPDGPFMARFQDVRPKVRKSSFYYNNEKKLYNKVMYFFITTMKRTGKNTAIVKGGYYQSDKACAGHIYYMKMEDGIWQIDRVSVEWVL